MVEYKCSTSCGSFLDCKKHEKVTDVLVYTVCTWLASSSLIAPCSGRSGPKFFSSLVWWVIVSWTDWITCVQIRSLLGFRRQSMFFSPHYSWSTPLHSSVHFAISVARRLDTIRWSARVCSIKLAVMPIFLVHWLQQHRLSRERQSGRWIPSVLSALSVVQRSICSFLDRARSILGPICSTWWDLSYIS